MTLTIVLEGGQRVPVDTQECEALAIAWAAHTAASERSSAYFHTYSEVMEAAQSYTDDAGFEEFVDEVLA